MKIPPLKTLSHNINITLLKQSDSHYMIEKKENHMDIKLNYVEKGSGKPLILLHGNGENTDYFVHQIEYLSKSNRVIAIDTRGHGHTPRGTAPFTLDQFAEDLKFFLDSVNLTKVHLLGFSDGGNIAMIFTLKYPNYVDKLILNGANLNPYGVKLRYQIPICLGYWLLSLICLLDKKSIGKKEFLHLMVHQPLITKESLTNITSPTLVIVGNKDMIKQQHTRLIADSLPNSQLCILEGGHFIAHKNPEEFNQSILKFLSNN